MRADRLQPGDHVEVDVRGIFFTATVRSKHKGLIGITPDQPERYTWRTVSPRRIVRKYGTRQQRMEVAA